MRTLEQLRIDAFRKRRAYAQSMPKRGHLEHVHTYDEWRAKGFQVRRGSKAMGRNKEGIAVFGETQVDEKYDARDNGNYDEDWHLDFLDEW